MYPRRRMSQHTGEGHAISVVVTGLCKRRLCAARLDCVGRRIGLVEPWVLVECSGVHLEEDFWVIFPLVQVLQGGLTWQFINYRTVQDFKLIHWQLS